MSDPLRRDLMTVGELAELTGLTVRALHHYDQVGLLRPTARTPAGYRLYGPVEIRRLQNIASLRKLGLSLEDIIHCLDEGDPPLPEVLDTHLKRIDDEIRAATEQRERLDRIRERLDDEAMDLDVWLRTIQETLRAEAHYTAEQLDALAERGDELGIGRLSEVQEEWIAIFGELQSAVDEGLSPVHPRVAAVARKARSLIGEFTGGDVGLERSLQAMMEAEGSRGLTDRGIHVRRDVWAFLGTAMEARQGKD